MRAICVDDEKLLMEHTVSMCAELPQMDEVKGFIKPKDALIWLEDNTADLALLDIDMPMMNGIELALQIKEKSPDTAIIFITGYSHYAVDAFRVRASGYLMKPVTKEMLAEDVAYALSGKPAKPKPHVLVCTFGNFDVFVDGKPVRFKMARCKELLAYLVDRHGRNVTRAEAFGILWEDRMYDRPMQKQMDVIIRSMRTTLQEYGIERIFELKHGSMRICPDQFTCDAYQFFEGNLDAINSYRGEYMTAYSWANMTEGYISWQMGKIMS